MRFCNAPNCNQPVFRTDKNTKKGYCSFHWRQYSTDINKRSIMQKAIDKNKNNNRQAAVKSKVRGLAHTTSNNVISTEDKELAVWYIHRSKEMTGICANCGGRTTKGDAKYWKYSIGHIMGKAIFPSVKTNVLNFIELCYFGNSCHANFDNNGYEYAAEKMPKAWKIIVERFKLMYLSIKEKSKIPDILLQQIEPI